MVISTNQLSFGGGITYGKIPYDSAWEDLGFVTDFTLNPITPPEITNGIYVVDSNGNLIKTLEIANSNYSDIKISGSFVLETMTRNIIQKYIFNGDDSTSGTPILKNGVEIPISALRFLSMPASGPTICLTLPICTLNFMSGDINLMSSTWNKTTVTFQSGFIESIDSTPTIRIKEVGETIPGFCE